MVIQFFNNLLLKDCLISHSLHVFLKLKYTCGFTVIWICQLYESRSNDQ